MILRTMKERILDRREIFDWAVARWRHAELLGAWNAWYDLVLQQKLAMQIRAEISSQQHPSSGIQLSIKRKAKMARAKKLQAEQVSCSQLTQQLALSEGMESVMVALVCLSVVLMSLQGTCDSALGSLFRCSPDNQRSWLLYSTVVEALLLFCTAAFTLEAAIKLVGLGFKYFLSLGNFFDFSVAVVSLSEVLLSSSSSLPLPSFTPILLSNPFVLLYLRLFPSCPLLLLFSVLSLFISVLTRLHLPLPPRPLELCRRSFSLGSFSPATLTASLPTTSPPPAPTPPLASRLSAPSAFSASSASSAGSQRCRPSRYRSSTC